MLAPSMAQKFSRLRRLEGEVILLSHGLENVWEWDTVDKDDTNRKTTLFLFTIPKFMLATSRIVCMKYKVVKNQPAWSISVCRTTIAQDKNFLSVWPFLLEI